MLSRYEQDMYLEALEQRHSARLIVTDTSEYQAGKTRRIEVPSV